MMSSQGANTLNAIIIYDPSYPYYLSYQIGYEIIVNSPPADRVPSVAGQPHRVIHVPLYFPEDFICSPASNHELPHPPSAGGDQPYFFPPHVHLNPPMYSAHPHANPQFHGGLPMDFQGPAEFQEQRDARVMVHGVNGQPGEFMVTDDTPYEAIPRYRECDEFQIEPEHIHNRRSQDVPKRKPTKRRQKKSRRSRQHPATAGTSRQGDTDARVMVQVVNGQPGEFMGTDDTPYEAIPRYRECDEFEREQEHIHNKRSQDVPKRKPTKRRQKKSRHSRQHPATAGTSRRGDTDAEQGTASEHGAKVPEYDGNIDIKGKMSPHKEGEQQHKCDEAIQVIQPKNYRVTSVCSQSTVSSVIKKMSSLDIGQESNDGKEDQAEGKCNTGTDVDSIKNMDD